MKRYNDDFAKKLKGFEFKTLEKSKHSIYALSKKLDVIYVNPAWVTFAKENGYNEEILNKTLDSSLINAFNGQQIKDDFYQTYSKVMATGKIWRNEYECSSANEFRYYHQGVYPLKNNDGLLIINTLMVKSPTKTINLKTDIDIVKRYLQPTGFINQCSNCKYTQRNNEIENWDWVPEFLEKMPSNISHSICPLCFDYHWKQNDNNDNKLQ